MSEQISDNPIITKLSCAFIEGHSRYLRAHIDSDFKNEILIPLRSALREYEMNEKDLYSGDLYTDSQHFLLRLRSVSLLVEGFYWIGSYKEGEIELQKYVQIEKILKTSSNKDINQIVLDLSLLPQMSGAASLLRNLAKRKREFIEIKKRLVRELIRIGVNMAVIFHYGSHNYDEASLVLEICRKLAEEISSDDSYPYGLFGQIDYFTACCWR